MATDDVLDDPTPATKPEGAPAPAVDKAAIAEAVKEGLSGIRGELGQFAKDVGAHVNAALQQTQQRVDAGKATKQEIDLTQRLLTNPEEAIGEVVQKVLTAQLGPYLQTQINDSYEELVEKHRSRIDAQWGEGAFDEFIRPDLEATIKATSNPAARASKEYISTVVRGIVGHEDILPKLQEKQSAMKEKQRERERDEAPVGILDGGRRKPGKLSLSDADRAYLTSLENDFGRKTDGKLLEQALAVRSRDGGWSIENFPGLKQEQ